MDPASVTLLVVLVVCSARPVAGQCDPIDNDQRVNCSSRGLTEVPSPFPNSTEYLDLSENDITYLQSDAFSGLGSLQQLLLHQNAITDIQPGTFSGLRSLRSLSLSHNDITDIQPGAFSGLESLQALTLWGNALTDIQPGAFSGLGSLLLLSLYHNDITDIQPGAFSGLESLQALYIGGNIRFVFYDNDLKVLANTTIVMTESRRGSPLPPLNVCRCGTVVDARMEPCNSSLCPERPTDGKDYSLTPLQTGLAAGLSVGLCVILAVVLAVVLVCRRGRIRQTQPQEAPNQPPVARGGLDLK